MNPFLVKMIFRPFIKRAAHTVLVGRNRDRKSLEKGRFTRVEVDNILKEVWQEYDRQAPSVPREPKLGNRMNMLLACMTLACLHVLVSAGVERNYAIELIGDLAWNVYKNWGQIPHFIARLLTRDTQTRMRMDVNMFLRFPFTPPGYQFRHLPDHQGVAFDMLRCPIAGYFENQDAADLCVETWCNLDFPLAEMWGGWLKRKETLAAGDARCDFRFQVKA